MCPARIGLAMPAMVPKVMEIPTSTLAYLGARSKWLICHPTKVTTLHDVNCLLMYFYAAIVCTRDGEATETNSNSEKDESCSSVIHEVQDK